MIEPVMNIFTAIGFVVCVLFIWIWGTVTAIPYIKEAFDKRFRDKAEYSAHYVGCQDYDFAIMEIRITRDMEVRLYDYARVSILSGDEKMDVSDTITQSLDVRMLINRAIWKEFERIENK